MRFAYAPPAGRSSHNERFPHLESRDIAIVEMNRNFGPAIPIGERAIVGAGS
jgi:hypothetical protein